MFRPKHAVARPNHTVGACSVQNVVVCPPEPSEVASVGSGIASQLQMFLILSELGAEPSVDHRPAVFLTNALTGWEGAATMEASLS